MVEIHVDEMRKKLLSDEENEVLDTECKALQDDLAKYAKLKVKAKEMKDLEKSLIERFDDIHRNHPFINFVKQGNLTLGPVSKDKTVINRAKFMKATTKEQQAKVFDSLTLTQQACKLVLGEFDLNKCFDTETSIKTTIYSPKKKK